MSDDPRDDQFLNELEELESEAEGFDSCATCSWFEASGGIAKRLGNKRGECTKLRARVVGPGLVAIDRELSGKAGQVRVAVESGWYCDEYERATGEEVEDDE